MLTPIERILYGFDLVSHCFLYVVNGARDGIARFFHATLQFLL
jgi:hypothetical protein